MKIKLLNTTGSYFEIEETPNVTIVEPIELYDASTPLEAAKAFVATQPWEDCVIVLPDGTEVNVSDPEVIEE